MKDEEEKAKESRLEVGRRKDRIRKAGKGEQK